ncbi:MULTISPECIES: hypothetical protein [Bacteria]|uniref:Uncharacterized protein n=2 Tax=Bacteria TaxID=2 RepID=A0A1I4V3P3_9BURK|nr:MULTISPECIES: hypothetical protein [Bacteria]SFE67462.1 hypothetical protein SAMN05216506_113126 [Saccharopolyspora kobensis]SFM95751.1 hypothetical protein SAMN02982985_05911 [Rugamonas rubra]
MSTADRELGQMMRGMIMAMGLAVDDVEAGRYTAADRERLAGGLELVVAGLRAQRRPGERLVIDSERVGS